MMKKTMIGALVVTLALGMGNTVCAQKTKGGVFDLTNYTLHDGGVLKKGVNESFQGLFHHNKFNTLANLVK